MSQVPNRFDIPLDGLASRKAPSSPRTPKTTSDRFAITTESRQPTISTQNFIPKTDSRFGEIDTSEIEIAKICTS